MPFRARRNERETTSQERTGPLTLTSDSSRAVSISNDDAETRVSPDDALQHYAATLSDAEAASIRTSQRARRVWPGSMRWRPRRRHVAQRSALTPPQSSPTTAEFDRDVVRCCSGRAGRTGSLPGPEHRLSPAGIIGTGGMGRVWRSPCAARTEVAVKIVSAADSGGSAPIRGGTRHLADGSRTSRESGRRRRWRRTSLLRHGPGCRRPITRYCDDKARRRPTVEHSRTSAGRAARPSGIIHRDIKPSNVSWPNTTTARAKVIDFGVAKHRAAAPGADGPKSACWSARRVRSPEQAALRPARCGHSQLRTGVLLYELLTGDTPLARALRRSPLLECCHHPWRNPRARRARCVPRV